MMMRRYGWISRRRADVSRARRYVDRYESWRLRVLRWRRGQYSLSPIIKLGCQRVGGVIGRSSRRY